MDIDVVKVNPETNEIDDNVKLNTKTEVWLESGEYEEEYKQGRHNYELDMWGRYFRGSNYNIS